MFTCYWLLLFAGGLLQTFIFTNFCSRSKKKKVRFKPTIVTTHTSYLSLLVTSFRKVQMGGCSADLSPRCDDDFLLSRMTAGFYLPIIKNDRPSSTIGINGSTRHTTHGHGPFQLLPAQLERIRGAGTGIRSVGSFVLVPTLNQ